MKTNFDVAFLEQATETLRAVAHPIRMAIIDALHLNGKMSVTELYELLEIEQAVASHHLRIMKSRNIVGVDRQGKSSFYFLTKEEFYGVVDLIRKALFVPD